MNNIIVTLNKEGRVHIETASKVEDKKYEDLIKSTKIFNINNRNLLNSTYKEDLRILLKKGKSTYNYIRLLRMHGADKVADLLESDKLKT